MHSNDINDTSNNSFGDESIRSEVKEFKVLYNKQTSWKKMFVKLKQW